MHGHTPVKFSRLHDQGKDSANGKLTVTSRNAANSKNSEEQQEEKI
jgi:hypothetical protein